MRPFPRQRCPTGRQPTSRPLPSASQRRTQRQLAEARSAEGPPSSVAPNLPQLSETSTALCLLGRLLFPSDWSLSDLHTLPAPPSLPQGREETASPAFSAQGPALHELPWSRS